MSHVMSFCGVRFVYGVSEIQSLCYSSLLRTHACDLRRGLLLPRRSGALVPSRLCAGKEPAEMTELPTEFVRSSFSLPSYLYVDVNSKLTFTPSEDRAAVWFNTTNLVSETKFYGTNKARQRKHEIRAETEKEHTDQTVINSCA